MSDNEEQQSGEQAAAPTKAAGKPLLFGVAGGTFTIGAALGLFVVGPMINGRGAAKTAEAHEAPSGEHGEAAAAEASPLYLFDNMVLNPAGSNGSRFLLVATAVEVSDAGLVETLRSRDAEARDRLSAVLAARTVEQLTDLAQRDSLRSEIAASLSQMINKPKAVRRVHFPQFVVQ